MFKMNRKTIINKLISEGFSEKTLVSFNDKQLATLANRLLGEQMMGNLKVKADDLKKINPDTLKDKDVTVVPEAEVKEDSWDNKAIGKAHKVLKHSKSRNGSTIKGDKVFDGDNEDAYSGKDDFFKKLSTAKINPKTKELEASEGEIKENSEKKEIKKWVKGVTKENYHNFTSKGEIMELISTKMEVTTLNEKSHNGIPEFMTYDEITNNAAPAKEPSTKPTETPVKTPTKEPSRTDPRKKPFQPKNPNQPQVNPSPKATIKENKKAKK